MRLRYLFLLLSFIAITHTVNAQNNYATIKGVVKTTEGDCAQFVNVQLKGTSYGTVTNVSGNFEFKAPAGKYTLQVFSINTKRLELPVEIQCSAVNNLPDITVQTQCKDIEEVVVTGTRTEKRLSDSPVLTTVIREKEVRKAGAVTTLESLQDNIPGIVVSPNAMGNNMRIRGLNSRYVLFLVDGERMVSEGAGGNVNLDQMEVNNIQRVEMIEGASSALYGSNAVGAVINIITKEPTHKIDVGAKQVIESYNTLRSRIDLSSGLNKILVQAGTFRNASDGFGGEASGAYAARYEDYGANLKVRVKPTEKSDINVIGRFFSHETFNPARSFNVVHSLTNNFTAGINGGYTSVGKRNSLRVSANIDKYLDYNVFELKNDERGLKNSASFFSSRAINTFIPNERWELLGGVEMNNEINYATSTLGNNPTTKSLSDINLFAQAQYKILTNFDIVGGTRYTHNEQFGNALSPKLSLMYKTSGFTFRGGAGTAFRAPSIKELYYNFDHQGMFWVYGNPALKAEQGLYTSLSAEYLFDSFNASVTGYYNNIGNKITQYRVVNQQGGSELYYKNISSATLQGVNVSVAYRIISSLEIRGTYSYCDAIDISTGLQLPSNVKHSGTSAFTWNGNLLGTPYSIQVAGRFNSPILYQRAVTDNNGNQVLEKQESKTYSIWKIVLLKPFTVGKHLFELTAKADNIFNFSDAAFVNPGRQYMLGLRYNFKTN